MKKFLIIIVLVAGVAIAGGPLFTAKLAKDNLDMQIAETNAVPGYAAQLLNYQKSWFNSTAQLKFSITEQYWASMMAGNPLASGIASPSVTFDIKIDHGPLLLGDAVSVGLVRIEGSLDNSGMPELAEFSQKVGVDSLLSYRQVVNLLGAGSYTITSPAFDYKEAGSEFVYGGMELAGDFDLKDRTATMKGGFAEMRIVDSGTAVVIDPISLDGDMQVLNWAVQLGKFEMAFPGIKAYPGSDMTAEPVMSMSNLKVAMDAHKDGDETVAMEVVYSLDEMTGQGMDVKDFILDLSLNKLSIKALEQFAELYMSAMENATDPELMQMQLAMGGMSLGPEFLKHSPELNISNFGFKLNDQPMDANAVVSIDAEGMDTNNLNPQELMQKLAAKLNLNISEPLMQQFGPMMGMPLEMFEKTDSGYSISFSMENGAATLNGQPMPLPF